MRRIDQELFDAVKQGNLDRVQGCLSKGADVLARNSHHTVLHSAVSGNNEEVIKLVLNKIKKIKETGRYINQYINAKDTEGDTPLMWAAEAGEINAAKILLEYGASIDVKNNDGMTALHWATKNGHLGVKQLLMDNGQSFFDKRVEEQIELAIDEGDPKLVQILIGPRYSQLWHYWLGHAMISYNMLNVERATQCNLPLEIIKKQKEVLGKSLETFKSREQILKLFEEKKSALLNRKKHSKLTQQQEDLIDREIEEQSRALKETLVLFDENREGNIRPLSEEETDLINIKNVVSKMFNIASDTAQSYKELMEKENLPGANYLWCAPHERIQGKASDCNAVQVSGYTSQLLCNVSEATQLQFIEECSVAVDKMKKLIDNKVWGQVNLSTKGGYYLDKINDTLVGVRNYISGENGQVLDAAVGCIPNSTHSNFVRRCLAIFRPFVDGLITLDNILIKSNDDRYHNPNDLSCVRDKVQEISNIIKTLSKSEVEKKDLKEKLGKARQRVKENAIDKITDDKLLDKEFVHVMYDILLDYYLEMASKDEKNLLHGYVENNGKDQVKRKILNKTKSVDVEMLADLLKHAISKDKDANIAVISVLIVNLAHVKRLCQDLLNNCNNKKIKKLSEKSNNTIMIDVHDSLFDFDDELVNLVSTFPTQKGEFGKGSTENKIVFTHVGGEKYQKIMRQFNALKNELDEKRQTKKNQDSRNPNELNFFEGLFYKIYDWVYQGINEVQYSTIQSQAVELHRRALYADRFVDEGIMHDYVEKIKTEERNVTSDKEVKKYEERLCRIADQGWEKAEGRYTLDYFLADMGRMAKEIKEREEHEKNEEKWQAQERERQQAQARRDAEQKVEQEAQARQSAERKAKQLEQALERKNLEKVAIRACNRKLAKLDDELQDAINEESENKIVEAAVGCARGSPEQVVDAIIEEIKINREQIIKEGRVSAEIIEAGIRSFSNQGTSLSDVNVSCGASAGMGRN